MERSQSLVNPRETFIAACPEEAGELLYELWTNVAHLHLNWNSYRSLFGTSPERIELMNSIAPTFFGLLDGTLLHDIVLSIARLTDLPRLGNREGTERASLALLIERVMPCVTDIVLAEKWQQEIRELQDYCTPVRQIRNRILAHNDLATALEYHTDPLPGLSRAYIEEVLGRIRRILGDIEEHFCRSRTMYQHVVAPDDAEFLIDALQSTRENREYWQREFDWRYGSRKTTNGL